MSQDGLEPTDTVQQVVVAGPLTITLLPESETNDGRTRPHRHSDGHGTQPATRSRGSASPSLLSGTVYCAYNYSCGDGQYKLSNASGEASFTYTSSTSGQDTIYAYADDNGSGNPYDGDVPSTRRRRTGQCRMTPPRSSSTSHQLPRIDHRHRALRDCDGDDGHRQRMRQPAGRLHGERRQQRQLRLPTRTRTGQKHVLLHARPSPAPTRLRCSPTTTETASRTRSTDVEPTDSVQQVVVAGTVDDHAASGDRDQRRSAPNHTVTATVTDAIGDPVEGIGVTFTV